MDRLDYLKRDSFFTGVTEGVIGSDRIVRMMNVANDQLVVDVKGIYSIEKFLIARRLMYWQVYFHKAVLSAELLLVKILTRAKELAGINVHLFSTPALEYFLYHDISRDNFISGLNGSINSSHGIDSEKTLLSRFAILDDDDILSSAKSWTVHQDPVLSRLCDKLMNRKLFRIELQKEEFSKERINQLRKAVMQTYGIDEQESDYFVFTSTISNYTYSADDERIQILFQNGELKDVTDASDMLDMSILSKTVTKHYLCYPKDISV
jgi:HD superfamily phosphohydrolase